MDVTIIISVALVSAFLCLLLRQYKPEYATAVSLICGIFITALVIVKLIPALEEIASIASSSGVNLEYAEVLLKCLGISFLAQTGCDICRDCGETAIASKIEFAAKAAMVILALPLFKGVINIAIQLIDG